MEIPWYKNNPAEEYLSDTTKIEMLMQEGSGSRDCDCEAEIYYEEKSNESSSP